MILEVKVDGVYTPIGCAVSCSFHFENEIILKTDVNAGLFRKKRVRISDCNCSVSGLTTLENNETISDLYFLQEGVRRTEQDLRFRFTDEGGLSKQIQGMFIVQSNDINGDVSAFSEFDLNFEGTGGFSISDITDDSAGGLPGDVTFDWWDTTEGTDTISGPGHYGRSFSGKDVLLVSREGTQYDLNDPPVGREYGFNGTIISFDPLNPFNDGTRVYVLWQEDAS